MDWMGVGMTDLHIVECCECGVRFGFPENLYDKLHNRNPGTPFWCPNGHGQHFLAESWDTKLKREKSRLAQMRARAEAAEMEAKRERQRANGYKGAATRMKNRAAAGVCPCCNRHFVNLERHMKSRHSEADLTNVVELGQAAK